MSEAVKHTWSPQWAQHVKGWYEERRVDPETMQPEETPCGATCDICGGTFRKMCLSGLFRQHIANFAVAHAHRDPFSRDSGRRT